MSLAKLISGTQLANEIRESLRQQVLKWKHVLPTFAPGLRIIQVGGREDSNVYIRMKIRAATEIGIDARHVKLPRSTTEIELLERINIFNNDPKVHGIIVQMPLDSEMKIDSHKVTDAVSPEKDVDGLNTINEGRVSIGDLSGFMPCTPWGCIELIKRSGVKIAGAQAVVLGRSKIVGTPAAELLKWHNATVTVCHSKTKNIDDVCRTADILVVGIGKPEMIKGSWIKPGAVVIDCGINLKADINNKSGNRLVGDVDFEEAKLVASAITPVPGGVGPMTVAMLMQNTVRSASIAADHILRKSWNIAALTLRPAQHVPSDIEIARSQTPKDISVLAKEIGLIGNEISLYGNKKAKISLGVVDRLKPRVDGAYIVVAGITPTPLGEGKSTTLLGLVQALCVHRNRNAIACLRQPSQGPTFGVKGGAAGGGYAQVIPMEDFNLHLTGDIHAVTAANNLLAAQLDTRIFHENTQNDKALYERLVPSIKVASEIMAVLALSRNLEEMKLRLGRMVVAFSRKGIPVTADDLGVTGALTVLLKDALEPNLMQSLEGTPVLVHSGPFANIAHGCSSVVADEIALKLVGEYGFVCTEAGFGSDIGMEKFCNIKCRSSGLKPNAMVLVTTVRALKMHGGGAPVNPGSPLNKQYVEENLDLLQKGLPNMLQHISNGLAFGLTVIVAINRHSTDTNAEHEMIKTAALNEGASDAVVCSHWHYGGKGALDLADAVIKACEQPCNFKYIYDSDISLLDKMNIIAQKMYGAKKVELTANAKKELEQLIVAGFGGLPVCMSKTSSSFTDDPNIKGAPKNFTLHIQNLYVSAGAGFIVAMCGQISKMPGLPTRPCIYDIDYNTETGKIEGLF